MSTAPRSVPICEEPSDVQRYGITTLRCGDLPAVDGPMLCRPSASPLSALPRFRLYRKPQREDVSTQSPSKRVASQVALLAALALRSSRCALSSPANH